QTRRSYVCSDLSLASARLSNGIFARSASVEKHRPRQTQPAPYRAETAQADAGCTRQWPRHIADGGRRAKAPPTEDGAPEKTAATGGDPAAAAKSWLVHSRRACAYSRLSAAILAMIFPTARSTPGATSTSPSA